jgi:hypothetical protein
VESARAVYDRIMELRIATPQLVLNYALFLQVCGPGRCPCRRPLPAGRAAARVRLTLPARPLSWRSGTAQTVRLRQQLHTPLSAPAQTPRIAPAPPPPPQENKFWEDSFQVYERGVALFRFPHVRDIWAAYLKQFVERYGGKKLERARDLFEHALGMAPPEECRPLYLQYAQLEEQHGLARWGGREAAASGEGVGGCGRLGWRWGGG